MSPTRCSVTGTQPLKRPAALQAAPSAHLAATPCIALRSLPRRQQIQDPDVVFHDGQRFTGCPIIMEMLLL
jgi:hypothetical protein